MTKAGLQMKDFQYQFSETLLPSMLLLAHIGIRLPLILKPPAPAVVNSANGISDGEKLTERQLIRGFQLTILATI